MFQVSMVRTLQKGERICKKRVDSSQSKTCTKPSIFLSGDTESFRRLCWEESGLKSASKSDRDRLRKGWLLFQDDVVYDSSWSRGVRRRRRTILSLRGVCVSEDREEGERRFGTVTLSLLPDSSLIDRGSLRQFVWLGHSTPSSLRQRRRGGLCLRVVFDEAESSLDRGLARCKRRPRVVSKEEKVNCFKRSAALSLISGSLIMITLEPVPTTIMEFVAEGVMIRQTMKWITVNEQLYGMNGWIYRGVSLICETWQEAAFLPPIFLVPFATRNTPTSSDFLTWIQRLYQRCTCGTWYEWYI